MVNGEGSPARESPDIWSEPVEDPLYVGMMEGPNAPMALAFKWCGWRTKVFEKKPNVLGPPMNLLIKDVQKQVMVAMKEGQALGWGMECKSMTAALNIPDPDVPEAVPVRSKEHPMGLPELLGDDFLRGARTRLRA